MKKNIRPTVLFILDGCGHSEDKNFNAVANAKRPIWDSLWNTASSKCLIETAGEYVGLPKGQMGNSEVGHTTIGAGRVIFQSLSRINKAIENKSFYKNTVYCDAIDKAVKAKKSIHVLGLLSCGGVHSHENHLYELIKLAAARGSSNIKVHIILDGRDTPPKIARTSLVKIEALCQSIGVAKIVSVIGRYFAMDRDNRWDRTESAYKLISEGGGKYSAKDSIEALDNAYARNETDEFVNATSIGSGSIAENSVCDGDAVIFMNFRPDRARQITHAFVDKEFNHFKRHQFLKLGSFVMTTDYGSGLNCACAFPKLKIKNCLGEILEKNHKKQFRIAETEKYAHVTFFLNGGRETVFEGEERALLASPKISTYDLKPEMSGNEVTERLIAAIKSQQYDVIICNYANCDMVGHTGNYQAAVKSVEAVEQFVTKALQVIKANNGEALITADHGNVEIMFDEKTQQVHTQHTTLPVPIIYHGPKDLLLKKSGSLADIAPTILDLLDLSKPQEMTGSSLISR
ncbi:MAG: phosphoglycerate mutase (2,3-diphosphoglycerate-independent) [Porticoccaceae bacterium]|nr:phosphoglycerate mutase (2,3-diphosphoglycerate-independent) [Porticoccaceae bacterium]